MDDLKKLYTQFIKVQNETPFHFEKKLTSEFTLKAYNPICGDRFEIYIDQPMGSLDAVYFHGFGCAISKASTSVMVKSLTGKSGSDALSICNEFLDFMDKKVSVSELTLGKDVLAFSGIHDFPERYDCVTLAWKEMKKFLETKTTR